MSMNNKTYKNKNKTIKKIKILIFFKKINYYKIKKLKICIKIH